jgi:hypothetical protein
VDVVAVAALDQTLVDPMTIWFREVCFDRDMTSVAKIRLCPNEQVLGLPRVVRRVAVQTADIVAVVYRSWEMPLLVAITVAGEAAIGGLLLWQLAEPDDLADVSAAFYMRRTGTMTRLAAVPILQGGLEMRCIFEIVFENGVVARRARIRSKVFGRFLAGRYGILLLLAGCKCRSDRE